MATQVIFFGNSQSEFSNHYFQALLTAPCNLAGVVDVPPKDRDSTNPREGEYASFARVANQRGIPAFEPEDPNQVGFIDQVKTLQPDLFLSAGYPKILRGALLKVPCNLAANFHASLLPAYRGKHPVFWCLRNSERWSGLTVHVMDPGIDTGDILYQVRLRTRQNDSVSSLYTRIMEQSTDLVKRLISDLENNRLIRTPQPQNGASYFSSVTEEDFHLDWKLKADTLRRWIITTPGQCFASIQGERIYIISAHSASHVTQGIPGEIIQINRSNIHIATGEGLLILEQANSADNQRISLAAYCRMLGLLPGDIFG